MTFKESEHVNIIERLAEMAGSEVPADEMIKEAWKLDRRIPLYPGIVIMCMNAVMEKTDVSGLAPGDRVVATTGDSRVSGTVKSMEGTEIILKDAIVLKNPGEIKINVSGADKLEKINERTLEKVWPSLVFEKKTAQGGGK